MLFDDVKFTLAGFATRAAASPLGLPDTRQCPLRLDEQAVTVLLQPPVSLDTPFQIAPTPGQKLCDLDSFIRRDVRQLLPAPTGRISADRAQLRRKN